MQNCTVVMHCKASMFASKSSRKKKGYYNGPKGKVSLMARQPAQIESLSPERDLAWLVLSSCPTFSIKELIKNWIIV